MSTVLKFLLLGLGAGAMYGLLAQGLVLIYRASTIVNFAQGAIGGLGAYTYYEIAPHTATALAVVAGVAVTAVVGLAVHLLIMVPMMKRHSSPLARIVATLGVLTVIEQGLLIKYGVIGQFYKGFIPSHAWHISSSIIIGSDRIYLLLIGIGLSAILWFVYKTTRFGMATTASAENPIAAGALGWSPQVIMAINWTVGGALAGFAAILMGPLTGLSPSGGALFVVPALAAAMVGGFASFPLTLIGGLLVGVLESESAHYFPTWTTSIPFLVIIAILIVKGRPLPLRGFLTDRLPVVGSGRLRPGLVGFSILIVLGSLELFSPAWSGAMITSIIVGILCLSLVLVTGYAGQVSLAQYAMAGIGALISGRLAAAAGFPFLLAMLVGVVGTIAAGAIVALPALRVRGVNLAVVTLGLGIVIQNFVLGNPNWTGGAVEGTVVSSPHIGGWDVDAFTHPKSYAIVCLVAFILCAVVVSNIRRGRTGRRLLAVRDNERAAASIGVSVFSAKVYAFATASGIAGLGGVLLAFQNSNVNYAQFDFFSSITLVTLTVIGGIGFVGGAIIGGIGAATGLTQEILNHFFETTNYFLLALGVLLLLQLVALPDGVAVRMVTDLRKVTRRFIRQQPVTIRRASEPGGTAKVEPKRLEINGVSVVFGSVRAVSGVSVAVNPGEIVGLIGPNGAGKTTLIDAACGFVRPTEGTVKLGDQDISRMAPHRRAAVGLVRSWQSLELFEVLTVGENLLAASDKRDIRSFFTDLVHPGKPSATAAMATAIDEFNLGEVLGEYPADLSYAQRHLVGIARAVAASASILLLDEPAAGLDERSTDELVVLLKRLARDRGVGILLIEHDVPLVMKVSDRVVVLEQGRVLAEGSPAEMRGDQRVVDAYLGTSTDERVFAAPRQSRVPNAAHNGGRQGTAGEPPHDGDEREGAVRPVPVLKAVGASAGYGKLPVIVGLDLTVAPGEVVALLGANGAGKTTTLRMLSGVLPVSAGSVEIDGLNTRAPLHRRVRQGLGYVTEERSVFRSLTTGQNLRLGRGAVRSAIDLVPQLELLMNRRAGVLSGGEQQMLTLARSIAAKPRVLLADELSLGLAPLIVASLFAAVREAADQGIGVLLVEQQARAVLPFCDRAYVLRRGRVVMSVSAHEFADRLEEIENHYLWADVAGTEDAHTASGAGSVPTRPEEQ